MVPTKQAKSKNKKEKENEIEEKEERQLMKKGSSFLDSDEIICNLFTFTTSQENQFEMEGFIEANCLTFDDVEENKMEHMKIHQDYVKLVEKQLK